jgi:hypothetical protein
MAVAVFRGLEPAERATLAAALQQRQGDLPHPFEPRQYGSKKACWCGARLNDEIHTNRPPRPPRPGDRR